MKTANQRYTREMSRLKFPRISFVVCWLAGLVLAGCGQNSPPPVEPEPPALRLLTEDQYRNIIADVFGQHILVTGRFNPLFRTNGLRSLGARSAEITPASMKNFERMAQLISEQVFAPENRHSIMPCALTRGQNLAQSCAKDVLALFGELLFRRQMIEADVSTYVTVAEEVIRI